MANPLDEAFAELDADIEAARNPPRVVPPSAHSKAPSAKATPASPAKPASLMDQAKGALKAFQKDPVGQTTEAMKGVNASIIRAPGQLAGGIVDTSADVGIFIGENIDAGLIRAGQRPVFSGKRVYGAALADTLSMRSTVGQYGNQAVNQFSTEAVASLLPVTKALGAGKAATRLALAGGGAAASMETKEGDAPTRARNALIGAAAEGGGELIIRGGTAVLKRVIKPGTPAEAAKDSLDRAFATRRTAEARATQADAQVKGESPEIAPQEELPAGTRKGDAPASSHPNAALTDDANTALENAGAAERLTPETLEVSPQGKIVVDPSTKAAADDAGYGRAFAARVEGAQPEAVIFKEEAEDGSSRVVGAMGREDLTNFGADVAHLRDNPGDINLEAGSPHGQWKMAHLGAPYDAASVLRAIVESVPSGGRKLTDGELMEQAAAAADALGQSPDEALAFARQLATDQTDAATALKAVQTIWTRMGTDLDGISRDVDWGTAPEDLVEQARRSIHDLQMFSVAMEESKSGAGAALRTLGLPDADTYLAAARRVDRGEAVVPTAADNPPPLPRTRDELKDWVSMWDALKDNPAGRAQFLKGLRTYPSGSFYLRTAFANFFTGSILSAPKTILLNIAQPAFMGGLRTLERTAGAAMGSINPLLSATQRAEFRTIAAQAPISYVQTIGDIADAFKGAARAFADNQSPLGGKNPLDFTTGGIPQAMIEAAEREGKMALPYHLGNLLNYLPRAVFRLHGTTNEVALHMAYMGEVRAKAMLEAASSKLAPADAQALVRTRLSEASSNLDGSATDGASLDSATRTTMVRQPNEEFTPGVASFERTIQAWRKNLPELRFVLPIFQVPANAMGETLRRIPGAGFLMRETVEELSGSLGAFRKAEAYGRMTLGAGFLTAGVMMARNGLITGAGPQDPQDKALWLQTHQPYSFRAGDQWVAYDRMDPVGPLFAIAAGYFDTSVYRDTDRDMTLAAVGALAQYFKDKSALQGVSDVLNFGGDPRDQSTFMRRLGGTVGGFVPAFLQVPRAMADSGMNVKRNPWDYIVDRLPGASLSLDPLRNLLGEPVHKPQDTLLENLLPVTMSPVSDYAKEPVLDELDRLYNMTGYTPGMLSPAAGAQAHFDMRDVKLENGGSLYNQLMRARTTSTIDGVTLKQALHELFESDEYNEAPDGTGKVNDLEGGPREDTRGGMVQKVFTAYTAQTKIDVATSSPIARRWMAVAKIKADANQALRGTPASDLVENPALLEALGIDLADYEDKVSGQ